jgi:periplasmic protein TonB
LRLSTVIVSVGLHVALAVGLISVAQKRELRRKAISVAVTEEKKKAKPPKPPAPPKPIVHPALAKASVAPKAAASAPVHAAPTPMVTNLAMSNSDLDVGPGIGLLGRAPKAAAAAAAPTKVASAISEARTRRTKEEAGGGSPDAPCEEEPTKPEPEVQTPIDYSLFPQAQADGTEGKFRARLVIDADGQVVNVVVVAGVEPALDAAIVAALKRWRFKPAMACGKPVAGGVWPHAWVFELGD